MAKILVVEDDIQAARRMTSELAAEGHSCAVRRTGEGVVEWVRKARPDLVVLDVMIPGVSGFELCRSFRRDDDLYNLPVMFVSAMSDEEEIRYGLDQGADDYVAKPFEMRNFLQRVDALLKEHELVEEVDADIELMSAGGVRRELQRRISRGDTFALVYVELMNLREFAASAGAQARSKAVRHLARTLQHCGRSLKAADFFVGHMGSGCFACTVRKELARPFCERISLAWDGHLRRLYESVRHSEAYRAATEGEGASGSLVMPLFCITTCEEGENVTPNQMLETVSRIRNNNVGKTGGGIVMDRRTQPLSD